MSQDKKVYNCLRTGLSHLNVFFYFVPRGSSPLAVFKCLNVTVPIHLLLIQLDEGVFQFI